MKTEATVIEGVMYVFAKAKSEWELNNLGAGELPFDYHLKSYDYGDENNVRIHEFPVSCVIPEGIDLTLSCIDNLKEKIAGVKRQAKSDVKDLEDRIKALALIEYKPDVSSED